MLLSRCSGNLQTAKQTNKAHKEATEAGRHDADMETAYTPRHTHTHTQRRSVRQVGRRSGGGLRAMPWSTSSMTQKRQCGTETAPFAGPLTPPVQAAAVVKGKVTCSHSQRCCAWPEAGFRWLSGDVQKAGRDEIKVACKPHQE
jgi:hypothetical protein